MAEFRPLPEEGDGLPDEDAGIEMQRLEVHDPEEACVRIVGLHKTYMLGIEGVAALRGVDLSVAHGEFVTICGTSGGGARLRC